MKSKYDTKTFTFPSGTPTDIIEKTFMNSTYDYLATDDPLLQVIAARNCEVGIALNNFLKLTFGILFGAHVDPTLLNAINRGITYARSQRIQSQTFSTFFKDEKLSVCTDRPTTGSDSFKITDMQAPFLFIALGAAISIPVFVIYQIYKYFILVYKGNVIVEGVRSKQETRLKSQVRILYTLYLYASSKNITFLNRSLKGIQAALQLYLGDILFTRGQKLGRQVKVIDKFKRNFTASNQPTLRNISVARSNFRKIVKKVILTQHYKLSVDLVNQISTPKPVQKSRGSITSSRFSFLNINFFRRASASKAPPGFASLGTPRQQQHWLSTKESEQATTLFSEFHKKKPKLLTRKRMKTGCQMLFQSGYHRVEFKYGKISEPIIVENKTLKNLQFHLQKESKIMNSLED
eukprot:TRINITY_DN14108_c0_g3_i2.p1 TRINITY_DN14108_c0_g3~~TRINITY_DN14108_c0_g3_i2.p1  ORF type:complete len:406 (-),score=54.48 TRINITY_DN14108_c0_g3_i2:173-1390(-)